MLLVNRIANTYHRLFKSAAKIAIMARNTTKLESNFGRTMSFICQAINDSSELLLTTLDFSIIFAAA
jgi:hypothetical protein